MSTKRQWSYKRKRDRKSPPAATPSGPSKEWSVHVGAIHSTDDVDTRPEIATYTNEEDAKAFAREAALDKKREYTIDYHEQRRRHTFGIYTVTKDGRVLVGQTDTEAI